MSPMFYRLFFDFGRRDGGVSRSSEGGAAPANTAEIEEVK